MLDNKQRAHDLALLTVEILNKNPGDVDRLDVYKLYLEAYEMALEAFNRDFPEDEE